MGRFEVMGCIGMGGMGQVYEAYDPRLDRRVALKVLHADRDRRSDPRLIREAQGLARLSHPNVVAVHEVGVHAGRLFLAMELVDGVTLRDWLRKGAAEAIWSGRSTRSLVTVLGYLLQAGQGLAEAHQAELVHRDFKPGNVLIGRDGRVRVVDFGLVRMAEAPVRGSASQGALEHEGEGASVEQGQIDWVGGRPLTRPGAIVGTPAYMAPEQLLGMDVGPASDQFGFCLTAWEAIFGVRAFPGKTIMGVLAAMRRGRPVRPRGVACPREVEVALRKGLAFRPERRHGSMGALLGVLKAARARLVGERLRRANGRRRWLGALALVGAVSSMAFVVSRGSGELCAGGEEQLAGVWDEARKEELQRAFAGSTPEAWERFEVEMDEYAREWMAGHRDACEAAVVRKEESIEVMYQRMACLDRRRRSMVELLETLEVMEAEVAEDVVQRAGELEEASMCAAIESPREVLSRASS